MHTFIINASLRMLCHSEVFQLSKGYLSSGSTTDTFQQQEQQNVLHHVQLHAAYYAEFHMALIINVCISRFFV
jgi:hypothetical protein